MDSENSMDNCALYIFLFLSLLSVGNDFYHVYTGILESDFMKEKNDKMSNYMTLFKNVLYNNVKKKNNRLIFEENKEDNKEDKKEDKKENSTEKKKEIKKDKKKKVKDEEKEKKIKKKIKELNENNLLDKKTNNDYEEKINILKKITKKE